MKKRSKKKAGKKKARRKTVKKKKVVKKTRKTAKKKSSNAKRFDVISIGSAAIDYFMDLPVDFNEINHGSKILVDNVNLLTGTHDYEEKKVNRQLKVPKMGRDIHIGKGVWIASNVTILGPCNIGDNCVIAANSLITGEIKKDSLYAGVPAKFIKKIRFKNEQ